MYVNLQHLQYKYTVQIYSTMYMYKYMHVHTLLHKQKLTEGIAVRFLSCGTHFLRKQIAQAEKLKVNKCVLK